MDFNFYFSSILKTYKVHPGPLSLLAFKAIIFLAGCMITPSALFGFLVYLLI